MVLCYLTSKLTTTENVRKVDADMVLEVGQAELIGGGCLTLTSSEFEQHLELRHFGEVQGTRQMRRLGK